MVDGATKESLERFDQQLYEPPVPGEASPDDAPGWSDEETFDSFVANAAALSQSTSRLGAAK